MIHAVYIQKSLFGDVLFFKLDDVPRKPFLDTNEFIIRTEIKISTLFKKSTTIFFNCQK